VIAVERPRSNCTSKVQVRPLVREGAQNQETRSCQVEKKNLVISSRWELDTKTGWPSVATSTSKTMQKGSRPFTNCQYKYCVSLSVKCVYLVVK
jgi:hypothetical protein